MHLSPGPSCCAFKRGSCCTQRGGREGSFSPSWGSPLGCRQPCFASALGLGGRCSAFFPPLCCDGATSFAIPPQRAALPPTSGHLTWMPSGWASGSPHIETLSSQVQRASPQGPLAGTYHSIYRLIDYLTQCLPSRRWPHHPSYLRSMALPIQLALLFMPLWYALQTAAQGQPLATIGVESQRGRVRHCNEHLQ